MAALWTELWDRVRQRCPVALMTRAAHEYLFTDSFLDDLFDDSALVNYAHQFLFSDLVGVLTGVVFSTDPSVRRAFLNAPATAARGTLTCFYEKLQRVEPATLRALVRATAAKVESLRGTRPRPHPELLPGYRLLVLDGNHFEATQNRLGGQSGAALPGQARAVLGHASGLVLDVRPWEDAHANEKEVLAAWGLDLRPGDVVVAGRPFCAGTVMDRIGAQKARFIIRHNASVGLHAVRPRRACGKTATGRVYESRVRYAQTKRVLRCVEVELDVPTRNGEKVVTLLTDVPVRAASGRRVADAYLCRRGIETVFWDLKVALTCEVDTLAGRAVRVRRVGGRVQRAARGHGRGGGGARAGRAGSAFGPHHVGRGGAHVGRVGLGPGSEGLGRGPGAECRGVRSVAAGGRRGHGPGRLPQDRPRAEEAQGPGAAMRADQQAHLDLPLPPAAEAVAQQELTVKGIPL